jgi:broad specificity phosphatase PhoE
MNTVHFVRHGENPANITGEFSHRVVDYPLTERGVAQAQATARYFQGKDIAAIYSSPLLRALQTAEIIATTLCLPVRMVEAFREVNVGSLELHPPSDEHWALHDRIFDDWLSGRASSRFPDGEDHTTLVRRMRRGLREALRGRDEQHIIIVAHGGIVAATAKTLCENAPPDASGKIPLIPNCGITRMRLELRRGMAYGAVEAWAESDHLEDCGWP